MAEHRKELRALTGFRFFLALWVVLYHQPFLPDVSWTANLPPPVPILLRTGYLAVGFFFVLSGFVLSYNYPLDQRWSRATLKRFGIARLARIYPVYLFGLLLIAPFVIGQILREYSQWKLAKGVVTATLNATLLQAWIPPAAMTWNFPGWSLSVEAFFYCCFPLLGLLTWRLTTFRRVTGIGVAVWIAALLVPFAAIAIPLTRPIPVALEAPVSSGPDANWIAFVAYHPLVQLPQFCIGILTGRAFSLLTADSTRQWFQGKGYLLYAPALALECLVIALCERGGVSYFLLGNGLLLPLHAAVVLGLAFSDGLLGRFLSSPPIVTLGRASYSLYILHIPVSMWLRLVTREFSSTPFVGMGAMAVYVAVAIGLSWLVWRVIEEPANRLTKALLA